MTPQTPPTDRPLTAGDGNAPCPGGWLIKDFADGWYWTPHRIAAVAALTDGHAVHPLARPAKSAASDAWQATIDRIVPVIAPMDAIEASEFCCEHTLLLDRTRIRRELAALASPPVSERERELEGALREIEAMCPATCETSLAHDMAQIASEALTAQPQEPV